jgi:hypothetical protein
MAQHDVTVELFYSGAWNDHTATDEVYTGEATHGRDVTITHGGREQSGGLTPATATLTFRSWRFNPDNVTGDLYGLIGRNTPIRITVDGDVRFEGEVSSWTPQQSLGGDVQVPDRWVDVDAGGDLRRLEAGTDPLPSSLRTFYRDAAAAPVAYWPLDSGQLSTTALPDIGAHNFNQPFPGAVFTLAGEEIAPWLEDGVGIDTGENVAGQVDMSAEPSQWTVDTMLRCDDNSRDFTLRVEGNTKDSGGAQIQWRLGFGIASDFWELSILFITPSGITGAVVDDGTFVIGDDQPHHIRMTVVQDGTAADWDVSIDGTSISTGTDTAHNVQGIGQIRVSSPASANTVPALFSHIAAWEGAPPALADTVDAAFGYAHEHAGDRFVRLSGESDVTDTVAGTAEDTVPMGPQFRGTLAAQYAEIAGTDDGIVFDTVASAGVTYKTGRDRYNQDPTLTLDYAAYEVAPPLKPVLDDKAIRNDITVSRRAGGTARAVDEDSVDDVGRYTSRPEVNVFSDLVLDASAGWAVHTGTAAGTRFEKVTVDLDACPHLVDDVVSTDVGDRITITNLPAELTPDTASLIVNGWRELAGPDRRKVTFNCTTEAALHVAELEHDDYATVGALFTTLSGNHTDTDTTLAIAPGGDGLWVYESDFDIVIGGERMTVTGESAGSGTFPNQSQVLTVVRSVNGVVKAQANGATVQLFNRAYIGL